MFLRRYQKVGEGLQSGAAEFANFLAVTGSGDLPWIAS